MISKLMGKTQTDSTSKETDREEMLERFDMIRCAANWQGIFSQLTNESTASVGSAPVYLIVEQVTWLGKLLASDPLYLVAKHGAAHLAVHLAPLKGCNTVSTCVQPSIDRYDMQTLTLDICGTSQSEVRRLL